MVGHDSHCRIIDFGTAKILETERTFTKSEIEFIQKVREQSIELQENTERSKSFVGSANYLAP